MKKPYKTLTSKTFRWLVTYACQVFRHSGRATCLTIMLSVALGTFNCYSASVKDSTDNSVTIESENSNRNDADAQALEKAKSILGDFVREVRPATCASKFVEGGQTERSVKSFTLFRCTYYYERILGMEKDGLISLSENANREEWPAINRAIKEKITAGADVNQKGMSGETAIFQAAVRGNLDLVKILLASGANPNIQSGSGQTPLEFLLFDSSSMDANLRIQSIKTLIGGGANVNQKGKDGRSPLHRVKTPEILSLLIKSGADVNARDSEGKTPLMILYNEGFMNQEEPNPYEKAHQRMIEILLKVKPNLQILDNDGRTVLDFCELQRGYAGHPNTCAPLKKAGARQTKVGIAKIQEDREYQNRMSNSGNSSAITIDSQFCAQWAMKMPPAATPRHSGDIDRACSNAWPRSSSDFAKCVQTWKDCAKFY